MSEQEVRAELARLLRAVRRPARQRAVEVVAAVAAFFRARGAPTELQAREVTALAVDEQLRNGWSQVVEDALGALGGSQAAMDTGNDDARGSAVNVALAAAMLVERLTERGRATPAQQIATWFLVNQLDDKVVRARGRYPMRGPLLAAACVGLARPAIRVRHTDLVVRLKLAIEQVATDDLALVADAASELRQLITEIEARIAETVDGEGAGARPDGAPVAADRVAGRVVEAGVVVVKERHRSLPRLRAQALFELGRALPAGFMLIQPALEEACAAFEAARTAFADVGDARWSAHAAAAAVQLLAWLGDHLTVEALEAHERRVIDHGVAAHQQVLAARLSPEAERPLTLLVRSAYQRAAWTRYVREAATPPETAEAIERMYADVHNVLGLAQELAGTHPWVALAWGTVAIEHVSHLLATFDAAQAAPVDDVEAEARAARALETLRHYVTPAVRDALVRCADVILKAPPPDRPIDPPGAPGPDLWTPRTSRGAMALRLHGALAAVLQAGALQPDGLAPAQWAIVERVAAGVRPVAMSPALMETVRSRERQALAASAATLTPAALVEYALRRAPVLERHLAHPALSDAQRLVLTGWIADLRAR